MIHLNPFHLIYLTKVFYDIEISIKLFKKFISLFKKLINKDVNVHSNFLMIE